MTTELPPAWREAPVLTGGHADAASRAAIARLGGILRNPARHADGSPRDTVVFSILDNEWPEAKPRLQARLDAHP